MSSWSASALARVAMLAELSAAMEGSRRITWTIGVASKRGKKGRTDAFDYDSYAYDRDHWACGYLEHLRRAGDRCVYRHCRDRRIAGPTGPVQPRPGYQGLRAPWLQPPRLPHDTTPSLKRITAIVM